MAESTFDGVEAMTPVGRFEWVQLKEVEEDDQGKKWWKVTMSWPKAYMETELKPIRAAAAQAAKKKWGQIPKALQPFLRDGDNPEHNTADRESLYGRVYLTIKAKEESPPGIVDAKKNDISALDIWSGCTGRVSMLMGGYENKGKKGIWCRLQNVQKAQSGERVTNKPKASSQFDELEGGDSSDDDII